MFTTGYPIRFRHEMVGLPIHRLNPAWQALFAFGYLIIAVENGNRL